MAEGKTDNKNQNQPAPVVQPGTVVTPGGVETDQPRAPITFDQDGPAQPGSVVAPADLQPASPSIPEPVPAPEPSPVPEAVIASSSTSSPLPEPLPVPEGTITWTASEFVAHDKSAGWYLSLALVAALASAVVYLISRDIISVGVVLAAGALLGVYGSHKPRQLEYRLSEQGIAIGEKTYSYDEFRSFAVVPEGAFSSITFMPLKRFSPPISIFYAPEDEDRIIALLSDRLPFEEHSDAVDNLMRKIRF
jgi:hypothetical protein